MLTNSFMDEPSRMGTVLLLSQASQDLEIQRDMDIWSSSMLDLFWQYGIESRGVDYLEKLDLLPLKYKYVFRRASASKDLTEIHD